jgi:cellulose synthase/poly-beta-1,6-N-acetylglucosamine synthase-like glycosyltransferase
MYVFTFVVQIILLAAFLWACSTIFVGMITQKRVPAPATEEGNFAVVICAHNEERVLDKLLKSLMDQTYPREHYHVFLFADHCTDGTVAIGRNYPKVTVFEREEGPRTGKGAVLAWGIEKIRQKYRGAFTHIIVFDADNVADRDFLHWMNVSFCGGARLVMGNRLPLNPCDNIISEWYSMYWLSVDTLFSQPRYNVNMPAIISGTGFGFDFSLLDPEGWRTITVTEDMEFSMQMNFRGVFSEYQEKARFYDEQPVNASTLINQFRRWFTGNFQIARAYWRPWLDHFRKNPDGRLIDNFVPVLMCTIFGFYFICNVFWLFYNAVTGLPLFAAKDIIWWIFLYLLSLGVGYASISRSGYSTGRFLPGILTGGFFCIFISLIAVYSIFRPSKKWVPIAHIHTEGPET